jgi:hypothetical protein
LIEKSQNLLKFIKKLTFYLFRLFKKSNLRVYNSKKILLYIRFYLIRYFFNFNDSTFKFLLSNLSVNKKFDNLLSFMNIKSLNIFNDLFSYKRNINSYSSYLKDDFSIKKQTRNFSLFLERALLLKGFFRCK